MNIGTTARSPRGLYEVSVLVGSASQPLYRRTGDGKVFVAGSPGTVYTLSVRNLTSHRIEVINTVDGRHTLKDEPGDVNACLGLVFRGHATGQFTGWRISDQQTREFVFGSPAASVAAQATGSTENVGVIGFAAYSEQELMHNSTWGGPGGSFTYRGGPAGQSVGLATASAGGSSLGTGIGKAQQDAIGHTTFTRSGAPDILVIGYDTEDALRAQGIIGQHEPSAFPGSDTGYRKYVSQ